MDHQAALSSWQLLKPGGCLYFNADSPIPLGTRSLCRVACVNCTVIARELGEAVLAPLVMLAAMARHTGVLAEATLKKAHRRKFARLGDEQLRLHDLALERGFTEGELVSYERLGNVETKTVTALSVGRRAFPVAI
jgi:Pyruvate/2-oxoacid:ferredoxin oxidoreductase gamma subunit